MLFLNKNTFFLAAAAVLVGCGSNPNGKDPAVQVGEAVLSKQELQQVGRGFGSEDSLQQVQFYTRQWVEKELIWQVAQSAVSETEDIKQKVAQYRKDLILNAYYEQLVKDEIDTSISNQQIAEYYQQNKQDFSNGEDLVRCHYIKIPKDADGADKIRGWFGEDSKLYFDKIKTFCTNNKLSYALDEQAWIPLQKIKQRLPAKIQPDRYEAGETLDKSYDDFIYLLRIFEYKAASDASPLVMVQDEIRAILLFQRKQAILEKLKADILQQAEQDGKIKRF